MRLAVRYCATPGGRVAYSVAAHGPPLLMEPGWITDLQAQQGLLDFGRVIDRLSERFTVIRYDRPGCGLSDRDGDLSFQGQLAVALAAIDPQRVASLVLYGTCANGQELAPAPVRESIVALVRAHWGLGFKALASAFVTDPTPADLAAFATFQREAAPAATAADLLQLYYSTDVTSLLPAVQARTAVLHRVADQGTPFELGRRLAAQIPDATLIPLVGSSHLFYHGDWQAVVDAVIRFAAAPEVTRSPLTAREREVATLVAHGLTNQAIASRLGIAPRTAESHVENIRRKLEMRSRAQIAAWAVRHDPAG